MARLDPLRRAIARSPAEIETARPDTICIGSTLTFLYYNLYLYSAYVAHYVNYNKINVALTIAKCHFFITKEEKVVFPGIY